VLDVKEVLDAQGLPRAEIQRRVLELRELLQKKGVEAARLRVFERRAVVLLNQKDEQRFRDELVAYLSDLQREASKTEDHFSGVGYVLSGKIVEVKRPEPKATAPKPVSALPPLETLVKVRVVTAPISALLQPANPQVAALAEKEEGDGNFNVGDKIPWAHQAEILRVEPDKVTFRYGKDEKSMVEVVIAVPAPEPTPGAVASTAARPRAGSGERGRAGVGPRPPVQPLESFAEGITWKPETNRVDISARGVETLRRSQNPEDEFLRGVVTSTTTFEGKSAVQIRTLPAGGALARGGVQAGDALHSINGVRMSSVAQAASWVKQNPNLGTYTVTIIRRGRKITRNVAVPKQ
jgi:hypothetical protein